MPEIFDTMVSEVTADFMGRDIGYDVVAPGGRPFGYPTPSQCATEYIGKLPFDMVLLLLVDIAEDGGKFKFGDEQVLEEEIGAEDTLRRVTAFLVSERTEENPEVEERRRAQSDNFDVALDEFDHRDGWR
jgi:hypothetical protein